MGKKDNIAVLPTSHPNDEYCSVCGDDNIVVVVKGSVSCHYCSNQVNLCSWCKSVMMKNIDDLGI